MIIVIISNINNDNDIADDDNRLWHDYQST